MGGIMADPMVACGAEERYAWTASVRYNQEDLHPGDILFAVVSQEGGTAQCKRTVIHQKHAGPDHLQGRLACFVWSVDISRDHQGEGHTYSKGSCEAIRS
jgi:hypothetical protein